MPYRKRIRLWTNIKTWTPRPLRKKDCGQIEGNRHGETAQRAPSNRKETWPENYTLFKQRDLYRIPESLIKEIFGAINELFTILCFSISGLDARLVPMKKLRWMM